MLRKIENIEGYTGFRNEEVFSDTPPNACIVKFKVESEEMPALSREAGKLVRKNFVWIYKEFDLGRSKVARRIYDTVRFDDASGKWVVEELAAPTSDIATYTAEWNAFCRGQSDQTVGTPLLLLFPNDPSRVEYYAAYHIRSIEQLSALSEANAVDLGLGGLDDKRRADVYLARIERQAPALALHEAMTKKDGQIETLQAKLDELTQKLAAITERSDKEEPSGAPLTSPKKKSRYLSDATEADPVSA